ncbi:alpha/beta hydrolase [Wenzhouxiangella sp. XN24]|uniref:alpha/beta hydrolase n=1 Tax=Wenzhouxiangella sp. XN24 TaxID=2713569 RepID=UPI0013EB1253|nr:alpha/beta hydrolase [Wenzhouxiangella sp. XN24]NGX16801.1 alpha/beta hydrolase [Wenzhouxiangella sp. XN24]
MKVDFRFPACCRSVLLLLGAVLCSGCGALTVVNALSPSEHYVAETGQAYGDAPRQRLDVYRPDAAAPDAPVVVFFYGNGWREASRSDFEFVAAALTEVGYIVVIPDYRGHPDATFPRFVEDGAAAVAWTAGHVDGVRDGRRRLFLAGHSAGAHIAAMLAFDRRYLDALEDPPPVAGFIGLSGPYDFLPLEEGYLQEVFPESLRERSQPINFVSADAPPTLLIHGADDTRVLPGNSVHLLQALRTHDVPATLEIYPDTGHARVVAALAPPLGFLGDTLGDIVEFIADTPR